MKTADNTRPTGGRRTFLRAGLGLGALGLMGAGWAAWNGMSAQAATRSSGAIARRPSAMPGMDLFTGSDLAFGTVITVQVLHDDARQAGLAIEDALAQARRVDRLMSIYSPDSQVYALNAHGILHTPDAHLLTVLRSAAKVSALSGGAFDVTVQPLWNAYSDAARHHALPDRAQRDAARALADWRRLDVRDDAIRFTEPGRSLTLNGIAQGYAADLAQAALRARGIRHALIDTGEFGVLGRRSPTHPWTLGIHDPRRDAMRAAFLLEGRFSATSGDYATHFTDDFSAHHIFDPHTGKSPPELSSVTVLAPTGLLADALSTTFMVLGSQRALALAAQLDGVDAYLVDKRGKVFSTPAFPLA